MSNSSDDDKTLWGEYIKGIKPLKDNHKTKIQTRAPKSKRPSSKASAKQKSQLPVIQPPALLPVKIYAPPQPRDSLKYQGGKRIKRVQFQARLDLHGLYQAEAHRQLIVFIINCFAQGKQDLLVITGKGVRRKEVDDDESRTQGHDKERGVLKRNLPIWLEASEVRDLVHFYTKAHPHDGGEGAFYIRLRKNR